MTLRDKTAIAGRPRRFEPADELRRLFDAALVVMERNGYTDAAVADILAEADLSTRSFYRHFESKDQLLCALYRREAERAAERLTARVSAAATPLAALGSWIDEIMSLGFHRRKAARVAVLGSPGAMRAEGYADESRHAARLPAEGGPGRGTGLARGNAGRGLRRRKQARGQAAGRASRGAPRGRPARRDVPAGRPVRRRRARPVRHVGRCRAQSGARCAYLAR